MKNRVPRIVAIGGGKGGVGKSLVAANLAVAFARHGHNTVLIDADLGAANQHTLFGVDRVTATVHSFITRHVESLETLRIGVGLPKLTLIPGSSAIPGSANIGHAQKQRLMRHIEALDAEVVVIDVGAGIAYNVVDLFTLADLRLLVLLPQLTSFQNAYAFLKSAVHRTVRDAARLVDRADVVDDLAPSTETDRVEDLLDRIRMRDDTVARMAENRIRYFGAYLLGNQIISHKDRGTVAAVGRMFHDFLSLDAEIIGYLRYNRLMAASINERRPLVLNHPNDDCAKAMMGAARTLLDVDIEALRRARISADSGSSPSAYSPEEDARLITEIQTLLSA